MIFSERSCHGMILLTYQSVVGPHHGVALFDPPVSYSIFIGKITMGMPNLKNLF